MNTIPVKAYVLINVSAQKILNVLEKMRANPALLSAETVTGPFDIIAILQAENVNGVGKLVAQEIRNVQGVERTLTCIVVDI